MSNCHIHVSVIIYYEIILFKLETFSASRRKLAVVDEAGICMVFDITTKELLFQVKAIRTNKTETLKRHRNVARRYKAKCSFNINNNILKMRAMKKGITEKSKRD